MDVKKTALETGGNKGIGIAIVSALAHQGYLVWLGARDPDRGRAAAHKLSSQGLDVHYMLIDVTSQDSIRFARHRLEEQTDALDVLINNAGISGDPTKLPSQEKTDAIKAIYEVNVFGPIRVTQEFLPLLKKSESASVVMMSSGLGSLTLVMDESSIYSTANLLGYNSSKTALNAVTVAFAKELKSAGISVNAVEPGNVATDLNDHKGVLTPAEGAVSAVRLALAGGKSPGGGFFGADGPRPW